MQIASAGQGSTATYRFSHVCVRLVATRIAGFRAIVVRTQRAAAEGGQACRARGHGADYVGASRGLTSEQAFAGDMRETGGQQTAAMAGGTGEYRN